MDCRIVYHTVTTEESGSCGTVVALHSRLTPTVNGLVLVYPLARLIKSLNDRPLHVDGLQPLMYRRVTLHVAVCDRIAIANALKINSGDEENTNFPCDGLR